VKAANPALTARPAETPRLPLALLLGEEEASEELVRRDNGEWLRLQPPEEFALAPLGPLGLPLAAGEAVVFASPLASRHRPWLAAALPGAAGWLWAKPAAAARGALRAGRRIERRIPHYLDHLDQSDLAVLKRGEPVFEDLVPAGAIVEANREYVSAPITSLVWPAAMPRARFFIRKGPTRIRRSETAAMEPPAAAQKLVVELRQKPAQGWARLTVTAPAWELLRERPLVLNWQEMALESRSEREILEELRPPKPQVPRRVRYLPHLGLWDGSLRRPGLARVLEWTQVNRSESLQRLASWLAGRQVLDTMAGRQTFFPVGSEGDLPKGLEERVRRRFEQVIAEVGGRLLEDLRRGIAPRDNQALLCLTWIFARCPPAIRQELQRAARVRWSGSSHLLLQPLRAEVVVILALGRVSTEPEVLHEFIPLLAQHLDDFHALGAFAAMLSRPAATPQVLAGVDIGRLCRLLTERLRGLLGAEKFGPALKYVLLAAGGLLRVRELQPWALLAERNTEARELAETLERIAAKIAHPQGQIAAAQEKRKMAWELVKFLRGEGGSPDILIALDSIEETKDRDAPAA
jgi:hypothetical protein